MSSTVTEEALDELAAALVPRLDAFAELADPQWSPAAARTQRTRLRRLIRTREARFEVLKAEAETLVAELIELRRELGHVQRLIDQGPPARP